MNHTGRPHYYSTQNNAVRNTSPVELEPQQSVVWEPSASSGPYQAGGMQVYNDQEQPSLHVYQAEYNVGSEDYEALTSSPPSYPDCTGQIQYPKLKTPKAPTVKQRFKCPACDSTFDRESARQQHLRSHTGEKPFECEWCDTGFTTMSNLRRHMQTCKAAKRYESQGIQYYRASTALTTETTEDVRNRKLGLVYPRNDAQDLQPGASPWGCSPSFPSPERFALQDELTPMPYLPSSRNLSEPSSRQDPWSSYDSSETLQRSVEVGCAPDSVAPYGHHPGNHTTIRREEQSESQRIPSMFPTTQGPPMYSHRGYALTGGSHNNPEVAYEGPLPPSSSFPNLAAHRPSYPYERTDAPGSRH